MHLRQALLSLVLIAVGGCAKFPEPKGNVVVDLQTARYPTLLPFEALPEVPQADPLIVDPAQALAARAAALRARAAKLNNLPAG
jgi:hypothetical protein